MLFIASISARTLHAQVDPHFSQYYVYPSWLNPALTGIFDGDFRVAGIYRNQWNAVSTPYQTPGFSADFTTNKNINLGVSLMNQTAGDGGFSYLTGYGSISYTGIRFGPTGAQRLVLGLQAGMIQRKFDPSKLTFGDSWDPTTGLPVFPTHDFLSKTSASSFDAGAGALYFDGQPGKKANIYIGFAASHLTQPQDKFDAAAGNPKLPIRYTVHGGVKLNMSETFSLTPNFLYLRQGSADEKVIGAYGQIKANNNTDFLLGANYRFNDAVAPYVGIYFENIVLGLTYDVNTSSLGKMVNSASAFEISLSYTHKKTVKTPATEFICPRL